MWARQDIETIDLEKNINIILKKQKYTFATSCYHAHVAQSIVFNSMIDTCLSTPADRAKNMHCTMYSYTKMYSSLHI